VTRKDGSTVWIELISSPSIDSNGDWVGFQGVARDTTQRKNAEEALRESENRFRSYVELSPIGIFEADAEGRISSANLAQAGITGYTVDEILKLNIMDVVVPEYLDMCLEIFEKLKATGGPESVEIESIRANGQKMWELVTGVKLSSNRFLFFAQDVTDRKQAQEELLEMERKFLQSQKLESLGVLAGGIAHDFNNLLAVIIGNIELAQESDFSSSDRNLFLKTALSASMKSAGLVRQMLDYSGKGAFEFSELNLSELVENNIDMFRMTVPKNINLKVDRSSDNIFVKADVSQIQQVIMNLLINASEAIDGNNGAIEITTGAKYCNESILSENLLPEKPQPQDMAFILVRDDGVGMDAETVERIFDPFFSTKFVGRGLGMSVVHGVVRGHHGAVTVDSRPGAGTTVTVYLPLLHRTGSIDKSPTNDETDNISTREKASEARKFSVLVVDDEQIVLELVLTQLQHLGCKTFSAMDGKQAIDVFMKNPLINLVILDLVMPEMGGVEAFHRLMELNPELKIVMCSGYKEEHFKDEFKTGLQPIAFLDKPYRFSTLKTIIERLKNDPCSERPV
jgi:PAS domain S-box-containing protein